MKLELLTNATVVDDALRFVAEKSKEKIKLLDNSDEARKESNESDDSEDQIEEQEEQTGEVTTTNQVF
jgi:hypothetical protein